MKKLLFILILIISPVISLKSTEVKLYFNPGIGLYSMYSLSDLNSYFRQSLPFESKQVSDFPPYWNFDTSLQLWLNDSTRGIAAHYAQESTGSRISRVDYSGEYSNEFTVNNRIYAAELLYNQPRFHGLSVNYGLKAGIIYTNLFSREYIKVFEEDTLYTMNAEASSFFIEPGINIFYPVKFLEIGLSAGYLIDFGGEYKITQVNGENNMVGYPIGNPNRNEAIKSEWTGFRLRLYFGINITDLIKSF
ncbi:MAG: hypothetical protein A2X64_08585 [Ignavibacteria bacterium GWF2_33_9]|nr:MAG: hypothetical protein A2X64_08585 [Ignavibacteria bacterium GWF2_33_9]